MLSFISYEKYFWTKWLRIWRGITIEDERNLTRLCKIDFQGKEIHLNSSRTMYRLGETSTFQRPRIFKSGQLDELKRECYLNNRTDKVWIILKSVLSFIYEDGITCLSLFLKKDNAPFGFKFIREGRFMVSHSSLFISTLSMNAFFLSFKYHFQHLLL